MTGNVPSNFAFKNSGEIQFQHEESPLKFVICGLEHSGTTLLSDLFRQVPGIDAGWEGGVLLRPSPKDFEGFDPYFRNMLERWELTRDELTEACHAENFDGFYTKVKASSKILRPGTTEIFDKTPRYLAHLEHCMNRVEVPFVASFKDPRSWVFSAATRLSRKSQDFDVWYPQVLKQYGNYLKTCYTSYQQARARDDGKVAFVALESLCMDARASCERLFRHVGLEFKTEYVLLSKQRFPEVRANSISARIPFEYKEHLTDGQQRRIMDDFAELEDWFYE